jgi:hypothetical protein
MYTTKIKSFNEFVELISTKYSCGHLPLRWILWVGKSVANPAVVKLKSLYRCEFSFNLKYILSTWYLPMSPINADIEK